MTRAIQERLFDYERRVNELVRHRGFELVSRRLADTKHRVVLLETRYCRQEVSRSGNGRSGLTVLPSG